MIKTIWITGASSGIGEALAREYYRQGHNVVISARSEDKLNSLKEDLKADSRVLVLPLDLSSSDGFDTFTQQVITKFKAIDVLINNGGISQRSLAIETNISVVKRIFTVNVFGTIELTTSVLKQMRKQGYGSIATVSSLVGKFGTPFRSSYSASKHALHGYFDSLRAELDKSISISIICPGFVNTNVTINSLVGDGSQQGSMDEATSKAMEPCEFAVKAIKAIDSKKQEAYIGGNEVIGVYLKRFVPGIFSNIIRKVKVK